jgi:hypothetical protein
VPSPAISSRTADQIRYFNQSQAVKTLGLNIPDKLRALADEVIEQSTADVA